MMSKDKAAEGTKGQVLTDHLVESDLATARAVIEKTAELDQAVMVAKMEGTPYLEVGNALFDYFVQKMTREGQIKPDYVIYHDVMLFRVGTAEKILELEENVHRDAWIKYQVEKQYKETGK